MTFDDDALRDARAAVRARILADEPATLRELIRVSGFDAAARGRVSRRAEALVEQVRATGEVSAMEAFLAEYGLSSAEGVALMCLAEAMLRVPDDETVDDLIADKITPHDWGAHLGESASAVVNASTWALMLTGRVLNEGPEGVIGSLRAMTRRLGEPVVRRAVGAAMKELGAQFVLGRDIGEAASRGGRLAGKGYTFSYDMLGEAARTEADAERYFNAYADAIRAMASEGEAGDIRARPGISVKLSALHPRYELAQADLMLAQMVGRLSALCRLAAARGIGLNVDAEEADRLDPSLDVIAQTLAQPDLAGWDGFGVVVQAYGKRAMPVLEWLYALAARLDRRVMARLVKGAYWDAEIKRAQVLGLGGYPVFTRKAHTDVSFIACARALMRMRDRIYPQFATHNAHSAAAILEMAGDDRESWEFQRLHGMGEALHNILRKDEGARCRVYAPVGPHRDLLAYLVRRLLENGANSSFVNQIVDKEVPAAEIARDPISATEAGGGARHPGIPAPADIFGARRNSRGRDLTDPLELARIDAARAPFAAPHVWSAAPTIRAAGDGPRREAFNPARPDEAVGRVRDATPDQARAAIGVALSAQAGWAGAGASERAGALRAAADLYEAHEGEFLALATREAGKTLADGVAEIREAVDFLRYYAAHAPRAEAASAARGTIVCISPWNFPLAIFTGQVAAALATGNCVLAKPAEQSPLIAARAVALLHEAGVPEDVLQLLPGDGPGVGAELTRDPRIAGVCFTGSTEVARAIERGLAAHNPDAMLIAETGGLNAMLVDSSALLEQAARDVLRSAFQSAGQRCSALRILYVQEDVSEELLTMIEGAMRCLRPGDPWLLSTDIGPVIDAGARAEIADYLDLHAERVIARMDAPEDGLFVGPAMLRVSGVEDLAGEVFGPVLHVATFPAEDLIGTVHEINARGYGLTLGLHSRIDRRMRDVVAAARIGNIYVNRDQIGAVVGSQPFGGQGLSGTGPKAGGPYYLDRFRKPVQAGAPQPQDAADAVGAAPVAAGAIRRAFEKLDARGWARRNDRVPVLRAALRGAAEEAMAAAAALNFGPIDLPGPTGESNQFGLKPRGRALCLGPGREALLAQVAQALAAGCSVVAVAPGAPGALGALCGGVAPLKALDGAPPAPSDLAALEVDLFAQLGDFAALRLALSKDEGPIRRIVSDLIAPQDYVHEQAVCTDVTAAGGNASLLARAG